MIRFVTLFGLALLLAGCQSLPFEPQILSYDGNIVSRTYVFEGGRLSAEDAGQWTLDVEKHKVTSEATDYTLTFEMKEGEMASGGAAVRFSFDNWSAENYIFAPCYLYGGNRFRILPIGYAPFIYNPEDRPLDMPVTTTNVPHFANDGSDSYVDFRTNSCSTPWLASMTRWQKRDSSSLPSKTQFLGVRRFSSMSILPKSV